MAGMGLILGAYSLHLAYVHIPSLRDIFVDFDTTLPPVTAFVVRFCWLPCAIALLTVIAGVASAIIVRRAMLTTSCGLMLLTFLAVVMTHYALEQPWVALIESISGS